ncbi:MFS transporter [Streptomyces geysiriensis]|uniref:MFS transporter n=1 Tax=Streptomyces geysiriensis TaxID=68207 RepID=UPI001C7DA2C8|nr:MFS transporter [Streptomyces geysiriensis]MBX4178448.1 MFS transporter [Streptomyces geysiriensis]
MPRHTTTPSPPLTASDTGPVNTRTQKRVLTVLFASQILSGLGLAAGTTVAALLVQDMLHSTALAGLSSGLLTAGSALAAIAVGRLSQARGRRPGLATGYLVGALGAAGVITAAATDSPALLFVALFLYGAGTAVNLQARYAGADLAAPAHRARAISTVLVATTLGGVAGPALAGPTGTLAVALGLPSLTGLFVIATAAFTLAALVLMIWLRPDPLLIARTLHTHTAGTSAPPASEPAPGTTRRGPSLPLGVLVLVLTQIVMVAVMTMTPVHMHAHGHGTAASGIVIALHVGAMYLPSPLTGRLVDRFGPAPIAVWAALTLLASGILAATAPDSSVALLALALVLLGLGWNFGLVSGTAIVTDAVPLTTRAKTQGLVDVAVAIAGAAGGMASGLVVAAAGYPALAITGAALALALLPAIIATARKR